MPVQAEKEKEGCNQKDDPFQQSPGTLALALVSAFAEAGSPTHSRDVSPGSRNHQPWQPWSKPDRNLVNNLVGFGEYGK